MNWQVGNVRITRIVELTFPMQPAALLAQFDSTKLIDHAGWLTPNFLQPDGQFVIAIQALLIESKNKRIIVDTCMGNDRPLPGGYPALQTTFLSDLETIASRDSIDYVLCTHLHFDHIGWNTMLQADQWVPTFPNARYLFGRQEYEHWATGTKDLYVDLRYAVNPIVQAGLHQLVDPDYRITEEVYLESTPGHTPGHASVRISSAGQEALITGDMVHTPVQLAEPTWSSCSDALPALAIETRRRMVELLCNKPVLIIGTHFPSPTAGLLVAEGSSCRLQSP